MSNWQHENVKSNRNKTENGVKQEKYILWPLFYFYGIFILVCQIFLGLFFVSSGVVFFPFVGLVVLGNNINIQHFRPTCHISLLYIFYIFCVFFLVLKNASIK